MSDTLEQQSEDVTPATTPDSSATPTPPSKSSGDLDDLLSEFDAAVPPSPKDDSGAGAAEVDPELQNEAAAALREMEPRAQNDDVLAALQNENLAWRQEARRAADVADFTELASSIQKQLPEHVPDDYAATQLLALSAINPNLKAAFDLRNADRRAADLQLRKVEAALASDPNAPKEKVAALWQYGNRLGLALNAKEIIKRATNEVVRRAKAFKPIDPDATADREMVAAAVRDAHHKIEPTAPPDLSELSNRELRDHVRREYGFDVGV
jgi:hypothetical protein